MDRVEVPKIPISQASPSTSGRGDSQVERYSGDTFSTKSLEQFPVMSLPGTSGNPELESSEASNIRLEEEVMAILSHIQVMEDGSSMFRLPLASVDTQFPTTINAVEQCKPLPVSSPTLPGIGFANAIPFWSAGNYHPHFPMESSLPKPGPNFFQFPEVSVYPPRVTAKPFLKIFCGQSHNLVKNLIRFDLEVQHLSSKAEVDAMMFEVFVTTPDGTKQACFLEANENRTDKAFIGSFWAEEDGLYELTGKLIIPPMKLGNSPQHQEILGSLTIPVTRNYSEDCLKESLGIQCEFSHRDDVALNEGPPSWSRAETEGDRANSNCKLWGLTVDTRTNNLLYTDRAGNEVTCVHPDGRILLKFGRFILHCPTGISYDDQHGRVLVADKDCHRISIFSTDGQYIRSFGTMGHENGMFNYPWDVAASPNGQFIAVTDSKNKRIQLFDRFGNFLNKYSIYERNPLNYKSQLDNPRGICFDGTGENMYVTDFNVQNVLRISLECNRSNKIIPSMMLRRPHGIAVDWAGNLLIADSRNNCVRHVSPKGELIANITHVLNKPMEAPVNVATLAGGFVAVLDGNGKIHIF